MAVYEYKARDIKGKMINGVMEAETRQILMNRIREMGYYVARISEQKQGVFSTDLSNILERFERIKSKDLIVFTQQLSTMISAGISITNSLNALSEQIENKKFKAVINNLRERVEAGNSFSHALEKHPRVFSHLFVSMVRAGEAGGLLEEVLARLAVFAEEEAELKAEIRGALTYPIILTLVMMAVITFLVTFVIPRFAGIFAELGGALPLPTRILMGISNFSRNYWCLVLGIFFSLGLGFRWWIKTEKGRFKFDQILLKLPIIGNLVQKVVISRFARILGSLHSSGVPILESLEIVEGTIGNKVISKVLTTARESVRGGRTLAEPLRKSRVFPTMVTQMISTGEGSGALAKMLHKVSDFYDKEVSHAVKTLTAALEPIMLVLMGGVVMVIALSVLLPMYDLIGIAG